MCGIAGFFHPEQQFSNDGKQKEILNAMKDSLSRRGPDDSGTYLHDGFALAHTRLSIRDLTTGHQPITKKL